MKRLKKLLSIILVGSITMTIFNATVVKTVKAATTTIQTDLQRKIVGYFPEWAYQRPEQNYFNVTDLQWDSLTHIQYSFAMVDSITNKITFGDKHAAIEEDFAGVDLSYKEQPVSLDPNLSYKGHFNLLQQMKKKYPNVKTLISVGGWAGSRGFYTMMDTDSGIETFANSCVDFIRSYGFDGVDIDFEYPSSTSQSGNPADFDVSEPRRATINDRYNVLMKTLREKLDKAGSDDGKHYSLTAAVSASSWVLGGVASNEYAKYLDFLSIMSYDYHGGWNSYVENQANIYPDPADKETAGMLMPVLAMDWSYRYYRGVLPPEKILMGIPYYTRGWENVQGGNGSGLHGTSNTPATGKYNIWGDDDAQGNKIPAGANPLWHVLNLMDRDPNLQVKWDDVGKVPYVWQNNEKVFLSFENERSIDERLKYIQEKNLGGALIWVMSGDYGLNPNYVSGSTDVNKGKYTFGDTLTKRLSDGLKAMGPAIETKEDSTVGSIAVDVKLTGKYDHPNYTYTLDVKNNTNTKIDGGWEISFDLPKSAIFKSAWGGTVTQKDNGDFTNITIKSSGWQSLDPGATATLQGMIGLCFSGVRNITFNGLKPGGSGEVTPPANTAPVISGATNKSIYVGDSFDAMAGVTATDKEDGVLTSAVVVTGTVDTSKAGSYTLTYAVTDSKGLKTTVTRVVTVNEVPVNTAPVISGATNKSIYVGDSFDAMAGVTATDKEDGVLTSAVVVTGTVDTSKAGSYTLTYVVTDSNGLKAAVTRVITVVEKTGPSGDTYDKNKVYLAGDKVIYNGVEYRAKWWTQGEIPGQSAVWERATTTNPDGSVDYIAGTAYTGGTIVKYNGSLYKANWWTTSTPGSDGSWTKL